MKKILCWLLAALMVTAGVLHFAMPAAFAKAVPSYLPYPFALVYISGFFEILGGIGLLIPQLRRAAAWGLVALFIAVFPANVNMAIHQIPLGEMPTSALALWIRLPVQLVLLAWAHWYTNAPD